MKRLLSILLIIVGTFVYATVPTEESISKLYIATFDRAPDAAGLEYWLNESKLSLEEIAQSFFDQSETKNRYSSNNTNTDFINAIYRNILGRDSDSAGRDYWLAQLNSKKINRSVFILAIMNGALGDDKKILENKNIVGLAFAKAGRNDLLEAREILKGVTTDDATVASILKSFGLDDTSGGAIVSPLNKHDVIDKIAKEWYVRIVVEDTTNNMKTAGAQLGQLETANAVTKHSLKALAPFRPTYLDVVFVNPTGLDAGSYKSNFHTSTSNADIWEFTIKSHDSSANMILSWRGLYVLQSYTDSEGRERYHEYRSMTNPLLSYMTLVDITTNTEMNVLENGAVNEYVFNMNGVKERTFRWKVKDSSISIQPRFEAMSKEVSRKLKSEQRLKALQIRALRKDAKARPDALERKRLESLDMLAPPTFEVLVK